MYYDEDILKKILDWYENPDYNITLHDLFEDCFSYYMNLWEEEDDYRMSDEYIGEIIAINNEDALYFADGTEFPGSIDELESYAA